MRARSALQFVLFQALWFVAVLGAARGRPWLGLLALGPYLLVHLCWHLGRLERRVATLARWLLAGLAGAALDGGLAACGRLSFPPPPLGWPAFLAPPFILALWIAFASLPGLSLAWLAGRPWLGALLGALGGPLSSAAGVRAGALAWGTAPGLTWLALALEYAVATPLFLRLLGPRAPEPQRRATVTSKRI